MRLNISKSGISTSIGRRGATVNISKRGTRATVGIPGTGISYSSYSSNKHSPTPQYNRILTATPAAPITTPGFSFWTVVLILIALIVAISSLANFNSENNLLWFLGSIVLVVLLIGRAVRKTSKYNKAVIAQLAKTEEETRVQYEKRLELVRERYSQRLLSEKNQELLIEHISARSWSLDHIDLEMEKARQFYARINYLNDKYGDLADKIYNEEFWIGMTREQVIDSKGREPDKIEVEALKTKTKEILIYGNKSSGDVFVIENGLLARFIDR